LSGSVLFRFCADQRDDDEILVDPKYRKLLNDAAICVWQYTRQDYVPDEAFMALLQRASSIKPLSIRIVDAILDRWQDEQADTARSTRRATQPAAPEPVPSQEEVTAEMETLSDSALEKLRTQTLRHRGHLIRQFDTDVLGR
jgi:hypothetical protein